MTKSLRFLALASFALCAGSLPAQTTLQVGDLTIIGVNTSNPDSLTFVTWVPLAADTVIKFTDNGFLSSGSATLANNARGSEDVTIWKNTSGATIAAGTVISINALAASTGSIVGGATNGLINLSSTGGDQIFAYQSATDTGLRPGFASSDTTTTFSGNLLFGIHLRGSTGGVANATWLTIGAADSGSSYLPAELLLPGGNLSFGASAVVHAQYTGSRSGLGSLALYKTLVNNPLNWTTGASGTTTLNLTAFTAIPEPFAAASLAGAAALAGVTLRRRRSARTRG